MSRSVRSVSVGAVVPSLVAWGRSPDADLVYRAMATFGASTDGELARELGLARRRVADALAELVSIGAVTRRRAEASRETIWTARPPAEVVASLRRARVGGDLVRAGRPAHPLGDPWALADVARHLRTRALTRLRLAELIGVVRHEHLAMNTERVFDEASARSGVPMDRRLLGRGVATRVLGVQSPSPDPLWSYGRKANERGPDYRCASAVPMKLIVIDRKIALLPVAQDDFSRGYLELAHPPLVDALVALFERNWATATDPWETAVPDVVLSPRERAVVTLLAAGHTDATAARELRISQRSVTNILRALMDRLGVDNRFQLGLALGALHTVNPRRAVSPPAEEAQA